MRPQPSQWQNTETRRGEFDGYNIAGKKYENLVSLEISWHITVSGINPAHRYWESHGEFHSVTIHCFTDQARDLIQISNLLIKETIELTERRAMLKAIDEWTACIIAT